VAEVVEALTLSRSQTLVNIPALLVAFAATSTTLLHPLQGADGTVTGATPSQHPVLGPTVCLLRARKAMSPSHGDGSGDGTVSEAESLGTVHIRR
jgi:hypothetical protein